MPLEKGVAGRVFTLYVLPLIGIVLMAIPAWDALDSGGITITSMILVVVWLIGAALVAYSVSLNLRDVRRERSLRSQLVTLKDEHQTQLDGLKKRFDEESTKHKNEITQLLAKHEADIRDHRKIVIHAAYWGMGGIRRIYSQDITSWLDFILSAIQIKSSRCAPPKIPLATVDIPDWKKKNYGLDSRAHVRPSQ